MVFDSCYLVFGIWYSVFSIRFGIQYSGILYLLFDLGIRFLCMLFSIFFFLVLGIWYSVFGSWYLKSEFCTQLLGVGDNWAWQKKSKKFKYFIGFAQKIPKNLKNINLSYSTPFPYADFPLKLQIWLICIKFQYLNCFFKKSIKANIKRESIYQHPNRINLSATHSQPYQHQPPLTHTHTHTQPTAVARSHVLSINFSEEKFLSKQNQQISKVIKKL